MAVCEGELQNSIHNSFLNLETHEFSCLAQILVSESIIHSQRMRAIVESPLKVEKLIGYLQSLSMGQKTLLVGRVTLGLLTKILAAKEDYTTVQKKMVRNSVLGNKIPGNLNAKTAKKQDWNDADLSYRAWRDTDAALLLLIFSEAHDQQCLEAAKKWQVDPLLYRRFVNGDKMKIQPRSIVLRNYLCENILKTSYNLPGLMVDAGVHTAGLRSYVDLVCRYQRLLRALMSECENVKENPCPPASVATILSLPSAVYRCEGKQCTVCSICGDNMEAGLSVVSCLPCWHVYHWECIHPWLKTRNTCPVCRHQLPTDDVLYELAKHMKCVIQKSTC